MKMNFFFYIHFLASNRGFLFPIKQSMSIQLKILIPILQLEKKKKKNCWVKPWKNPSIVKLSNWYLERIRRKATAERVEREKIKRSACFGGWRLLAVRAADKVGFWYTENLDGFLGGGEPLSLPSMPVQWWCF